MKRLTKSTVEKAEIKAREYVLWEAELPGFGVRIHPSGRKKFIAKYRHGGRQRKITIGKFGVLTVDEARKNARKYLAEAATGEDPAQTLTESRNAPSVAEACDRYLSEHAEVHKKQSSIDNDRRLIEKRIKPAIGNLLIASVTRDDIRRLHDALQDRPYEANRALALLSKLCNLSELWGLRPDGTNPCRHVQKFPEHKRERFLSADEVQALGAALSDAEHKRTESPYVLAAIRLLLLTGCRRGEILALRWDDVDLDAARFTIHDGKTGTRTVDLNEAAADILANLERLPDNPYVIAGANAGRPLVNLSKAWKRLCEKAGIENVRLHDLRHTFASYGISSGLSLPMIGGLLGHTQPQTTARYAHLAADPRREATERIGQNISSAMQQKESK